MKGRMMMKKEKLIEEITVIMRKLDESQLVYILTFIKKLFGSL
jgi:hypothetical protein